MKISREEVLKIARLSRLSLTDDEAASLTRQLGEILEYVDQLKALDTKGVEPTAHMAEMATPLRDDSPRPCLTQAEALANAPNASGGAFVVPRIVEWATE